MTHIRKKSIAGLNVGDVFSISREFTEKDVMKAMIAEGDPTNIVIT